MIGPRWADLGTGGKSAQVLPDGFSGPISSFWFYFSWSQKEIGSSYGPKWISHAVNIVQIKKN